MTIKMSDADVDQHVAAARAKMLAILQQSERKFVEDVTARGEMTQEQALQVLNDEREGVLAGFDDTLRSIKAWLSSGCNGEIGATVQ